jgi:hypothetical protein
MDQNPPLFVPTAVYDSGGLSASRLAVGDLNGDGQPDLVVANQCHTCNPGSVGVLLGNRDGTFQPAVGYRSGGWNPWWIAIGDINGDGKPDLVAANFGNTVGVLLGNGNGTFQAPVVYSSGGYETFSVAIGDVNGDRMPDLAVASWCPRDVTCTNGVVAVMLGNGDGTFQTPVVYSSGGYQAYSVAIRDVNGDGKPDLIASNNCYDAGNCSNGGVGVLLGNGDGTFQAAASYSGGGSGTESVAVGDVNGDGQPDLITANGCVGFNVCDNGVVGVLLGNGDGSFQSPIAYSSGGAKAFSVAIADVNGDGHPDIAVTNVNANSVGVLLGVGDGTFQPAVTFDSGGYADYSIAIADVNGDTLPDLLVANVCEHYCADGSGEGAVGVLLNNRLGLHISTVTTLISAPNPSVFGQAVILTAQPSSSGGTPTGIVTLFEGSTIVGNATLVNGTASLSVSSQVVGAHSITAKYQGSLKFNPSMSAPINQVVNMALTTTSVASSLNPAGIHKSVTYTATMTGQYGGAVAGTVMFQDGGSTIATVAVANNRAAFSATYTRGGIHAISAVYSGNANNVASTSATLTEYVAAFSSKTAVITSGSPSYAGLPVTFTATVTSAKGIIPDGEVVTFYDGTATMASATMAGGRASYTTSTLSVKTHSIKATYAGDTSFLPSTGGVTQIIVKYPTTTALISLPNPSTYRQPVTFTAKVTSSGPTATGKVWFKDGTTGIGTVTLCGGVATLTKSTLAIGTHPITAQYLGDGASAKSTSSILSQVVQ